jgi:hypothetical protein
LIFAPDATATCGDSFPIITVHDLAIFPARRSLRDGPAVENAARRGCGNTARDCEQITDVSIAHFEEVKRVLDTEDPFNAH